MFLCVPAILSAPLRCCVFVFLCLYIYIYIYILLVTKLPLQMLWKNCPEHFPIYLVGAILSQHARPETLLFACFLLALWQLVCWRVAGILLAFAWCLLSLCCLFVDACSGGIWWGVLLFFVVFCWQKAGFVVNVLQTVCLLFAYFWLAVGVFILLKNCRLQKLWKNCPGYFFN